MATNDALLEVALNNLDLIGNIIGGELGAAIAGKSDSDKSLADFKDSMKKNVGNLKDIPDEVYAGIMTAYYDALKEKDAGQVFDELTSDEKNLTQRITSAIKKLVNPVDSKEVQITHSDGDVDTYKISFPLSGVGVDNVATVTKNNETAVLSWETETEGKVAMFKYFLSLWKLEQKLSDEILNACYNLFKTGAANLLKATYASVSSGELEEILGTSDKNEVKSKIADALPKNSYLTSALTKYGNLTKTYNNLQKEINSSKATYTSVNKATAKYVKAGQSFISYLNKKGVSVDATALPEVLDPIDPYLKYNTAMTIVSVLAGHGDKVDSTNYNKKVKTIDAAAFAEIIEIIGNAKANKIYGGTNDDTLSGGKGNDSLVGGAGNDTIYGDAGNDKLYGDAGDDILLGGKGNDFLRGGDGNDSIAGEAGNDKIYGDAGNDSIFGSEGKDTIWGGAGNDTLFGEAGNDKIYGDAGDDILLGGKGNDSLWGGDGANIFGYENDDSNDIIFDYAAGDDKIFLVSGSIDEVMMSGANVTFKIGDGSIKVNDVKDAEITIQFADESTSKYLNGELISGDQQ